MSLQVFSSFSSLVSRPSASARRALSSWITRGISACRGCTLGTGRGGVLAVPDVGGSSAAACAGTTAAGGAMAAAALRPSMSLRSCWNSCWSFAIGPLRAALPLEEGANDCMEVLLSLQVSSSASSLARSPGPGASGGNGPASPSCRRRARVSMPRCSRSSCIRECRKSEREAWSFSWFSAAATRTANAAASCSRSSRFWRCSSANPRSHSSRISVLSESFATSDQRRSSTCCAKRLPTSSLQEASFEACSCKSPCRRC
mmetsp:Transcript_44347/g.123291  ORF Transcript_44347/g.123291 Transcript_44347/m.123291 type:complete len:259 (-) Transcript_44347:31-807(-)